MYNGSGYRLALSLFPDQEVIIGKPSTCSPLTTGCTQALLMLALALAVAIVRPL
ncbi:MAG: hypothetical protein M5U34_40610 [Chloroflexi bacterium]|nr:hypothetical protein [Chloroflexota bacterium]